MRKTTQAIQTNFVYYFRKWTLSIWRTAKWGGRREAPIESRKRNKAVSTEPRVSLVFGDWLTEFHRHVKVAYDLGS